jgi:hypothetical protein
MKFLDKIVAMLKVQSSLINLLNKKTQPVGVRPLQGIVLRRRHSHTGEIGRVLPYASAQEIFFNPNLKFASTGSQTQDLRSAI